jgi:hypothetical protein
MSNSERKGGWTQTFTGKPFWPLDARPEDIDIRDVAHALSLVNRYNGHTPEPYSVAQHSVLVSYACMDLPEYQDGDEFLGLMHDTPESNIGDMISPMKKFVSQYLEAEKNLWAVYCRKFWMPLQLPPSVLKADLTVLAAEADRFFPVRPMDWKLPYPAAKVDVTPVDWRVAERMFMARFDELWPKHLERVRRAIWELQQEIPRTLT